MQFVIPSEEGRPARFAQTIRLVQMIDEAVVTVAELTFEIPQSQRTTLSGGLRVYLRSMGDVRSTPGDDVEEAAQLLAAVLHEHAGLPLVVLPSTGSAYGHERRQADVYPAGRHPIIRVRR